MKIVLLGDYYGEYLRDFHAQNERRLSSLTYDGHMEALTGDYFGAFSSYRDHFRRIGHAAELLVPNYYPLQQKWLAERGVALTSTPETKRQVALLQLQEMKPDVFFMASMWDYYGEFLGEVAKITPNIVTWIACPFPRDLDFSRVKCVLSGTEGISQILRGLGVKSERLLASFDPDILEKLEKRPKTVDVSFVGGISPSHRDRTELLEWLIRQKTSLEIWGYLQHTRLEKAQRLFLPSPIESRHRGGAWGLAMYQALADSKITLNAHIDFAKKISGGGNMRTYEATGCGTLLITDLSREMEDVFEAGRHLVVYRNREELRERILYYLDHEKEAAEIAAAGQRACLARHSLVERIREFDEILRRYSL
jgi:spore maturation protein CgeB